MQEENQPSYTISPKFSEMNAKELKRCVKETSTQIKTKIRELKLIKLTKDQKKLNNAYMEELYWLNDCDVQQEFYLETLQKIARNNTGKSEHYRVVELAELFKALNGDVADYTNFEDNALKQKLVVLSNYGEEEEEEDDDEEEQEFFTAEFLRNQTK